ncbi:hypothetical protein CBR_g68685 [Chara braunii]|uniref:Reverse transcriptase RNase H-like domain-containing protein n=1 Tax=Chara braunii TaxID=69332 RepID=A0A388K9K1_CHABU|nr:hypothetical protein CBR_g68685 [Chara braunii]|eukprot:GBG66701.1 hypothetical protein CBR_g68685 [Chara braunii]
MPETGGASVVPKKGVTLDDLIAAIDRHERNPSNIPKVDTFHFCGERVSKWLERVEQALVGRPDVVKFQRILQYVLHSYHLEVKKVIDAAQGSWERFKEGMQRKYRLGDGLLTTTDLEAMNKEDFMTIGAFVQEFKKRARKVHEISEEAQCVIFLGLRTASEAVELTRHGGGSTKLTWTTIDRGVEVGCLDQVEQRQVRLQRQKRKERDATASGTPGVTRIVTDVLVQLGYATEPVVQRRVVTAVKVKGKELWQGKEEPPFGVEEVGSNEEVTQGLRGGSETEEIIIIESDDEEKEERMEPPSALLERMKDLLDKMGRYQQKMAGLCKEVKGWRSNIPTVFLYDSGPESAPGRPGVNVVRSCLQPGIRGRPLTPQARLAQAARTRNQAKVSTSQEPPRGEHEPGRRKEAVEVEDDDDEEEEDERLRREEDQRAEQRARKKGIRGEAEPVIQDGPPKKKKYAVRLEEGFDVEKMIDRLLEGHNDLMTLKEILASAPRLRDELKGRLSRRLVPNVHLGTILPKEAEWAESGTKMDWKCVACGTVDLMVKGSKCAAMVDTGAEINIIREADAIRFGLDIDRSDSGILHGASCKAVFCGTTSNVLVEVGKVKARACFFIMPDVDHGILLGRAFVKNFAAKTENLKKLVRQDQEWVWGEEQEEVVAKMNEEFRKGGLVLGAPDSDATETRLFIVETDAGPTALGGVLIQADMEGKERPLRFESRTLYTTERNYSQFKRETLAVLHCLRIFRNYIFGRRFILRVDPTALAYSLRNYVPSDPTIARWLTYIWMFNFELERIPGSKNRVDGLSRINWDKQEGEAVKNTPPVDGFLDQEEDVRLHINKWSPRVPSCVGYPIWQAPKGYERRNELVPKPFEEEDPWGGKDVQWMMELALASSHSLVEDRRTIEEGPGQVERHEDLMGGMYLLVNTLLQESLDQSGSLNPAGNVDEIPESQDDEFEEGEIKETFRAEEYDGIYLELGLLLSREMRLRDASDRAQRMLQRYLVRDGHLFVRREVGNTRRVVCGRNRQIDVVAALHDGIAGGHRWVQATYAKISELYYWDGMMDMVGKFCRSCGEEHGEQAREVPREEVPQEEVRGTQRERELGDEGRHAGKEVIEVGEDTPPHAPAVGLRLGGAPGSARQAKEGLQREETPSPSSEKAPSPEGRAGRRRERAAVRREALILIDRHLAAHALEHPDLEEPAPAESRQESCQPEKEMEAEIPKRVDLHTRERMPAGETAEETRARRTRRIDEIWQERQRLEAAGELPKQQQERQRSEAAGALPGKSPSAPAKTPQIPEMWRNFWE